MVKGIPLRLTFYTVYPIAFCESLCYNTNMEYIDLYGIKASRLVLGLMRIADMPASDVERLVLAAGDIGINMLDLADIYGGGKCESLIGEVFKNVTGLRDRTVLQTKCGIKSGCYDLGYKHIIGSVDAALKRMNTDRIDVLLLHRPDTLMRPEEIARAFDELYRLGKVREFGVSNFSAMQTELLQRTVKQKLIIDQMQLSPTYCPMIESGINVNTRGDEAFDRDGGLLEYTRLNGITVQTYGTMQCAFEDADGYFSGSFMSERGRRKYFSLDYTLGGLAQKYSTQKEAVAVKWILHHPANMQAVIGTTNLKHLNAFGGCCEIPLTNKEWYDIYLAAGHKLP